MLVPPAARRRRWTASLAPPVLALGLLSGCGSGSSAQTQVRATLDRLGQAVAAHDYATVCDKLLAPSLTDQFSAIGLPCATGLARGFGAARSPKLTVRSVSVSGTRATAVVHTTAANQPASDDTVGLERVQGSWRVSALSPPARPRAKA